MSLFDLCMAAKKLLNIYVPYRSLPDEDIIKVESTSFEPTNSTTNVFTHIYQLYFTRYGDNCARYILTFYVRERNIQMIKWYQPDTDRQQFMVQEPMII